MNAIDFTPLLDALMPVIAGVIAALLGALLKRVGLEMNRRTVIDAVEGMARQVVADHLHHALDDGGQSRSDRPRPILLVARSWRLWGDRFTSIY